MCKSLTITTLLALLAATTTVTTVTGCRLEDSLTAEEAREALDESSVSSQAIALTASSVEISTNFTIGEALEDAAAELRTFIEAQLPCAAVEITATTLSIEYGANPGDCTYDGHRFEGIHSIDIEKNDEDDVIVHHTWDDLNNGKITVSGEATVTWSLDARSRRVVHELTWMRIVDGRTGVGSGDRLQTLLTGGALEGIEINGERSWQGESGDWALDIEEIEIRWEDPVPQAGVWTLDTPFEQQLGLEFERIDETTIGVSIHSGTRTVELKVGKLGVVSRR